MTESEEEIKNLLIKVKEGYENASLKLNIQKFKIMASSSSTSWSELPFLPPGDLPDPEIKPTSLLSPA